MGANERKYRIFLFFNNLIFFGTTQVINIKTCGCQISYKQKIG
jgi:hypothetical protein